MNERRAGPLRRMLRFCWNLIGSLRRGIANLLFLGLIAIVVLIMLMSIEGDYTYFTRLEFFDRDGA